MTTITIERELIEQALNALTLPCDRWNRQQFMIVKAATKYLEAALAAPATAPFDNESWDTVSGEPQNLWCDEAGTATVEDGTVEELNAVIDGARGTP